MEAAINTEKYEWFYTSENVGRDLSGAFNLRSIKTIFEDLTNSFEFLLLK